MISWLLFGLFAVLLFLSVPIGVALGLASTAALLYSGKVSSSYLVQGLVTAIDSFPLMAVPFFILAGDLMGHGGLSKRLLAVGNVIFGRFSGGLAVIAVAACMFFAAISGSGPATVAAIGAILFPAMRQEKYDQGFYTGLLASAGSLGVIIPPSIPMVIYATSANMSVSKMFIAGAIPGIIIGVALIVYAYLKSKRDGHRPEGKRYSARETFSIVWDAKWALAVPVIILGGIYGGIFTPTEAAAVGVIYGFVVGVFIYREIEWSDLFKIIVGSALTSATIMLIVGAATTFGRVLAIERIPVMLAEWIVGYVSSVFVLLVIINVLLVIVGCFMETLAAIIILTPILLPIVVKVGVDPTHFGIIMIVNLAIGMVTPPVGVNIFVASRIANVKLEKVIRGVLPCVLVMIVMLILITYVPSVSLLLPKLLGF
jgi:C4-dicarboxylate transporter DctM subunit